MPIESLMVGRVFEGKDQFFYTDITPNVLSSIIPIGKIYVNFVRGSGIAVAKLVRNDVAELNPDWNHRVNLPKVTTKDRLPYDYYNNAIYTWTNLDIRKYNIAKENRLNYFFFLIVIYDKIILGDGIYE